MKKIILALLAVSVFAVSGAFADYKWYVGGNIGYHADNVKYDQDSSTLGIGATVGYIINDKSDVSIGINYGADSIKPNGADKESVKSTEFSVGYEYLIASKGDFYFYIWGGFSYASLKGFDDGTNIDSDWSGKKYGISIVPNVQYSVTERIVIGVDLNFLSFDYYVTSGDGSYKRTEVGFDINSVATSPVTLTFSYLF